LLSLAFVIFVEKMAPKRKHDVIEDGKTKKKKRDSGIVTGDVEYDTSHVSDFGLIPHYGVRREELRLAREYEKLKPELKPTFNTIGLTLQYGVVPPGTSAWDDWPFRHKDLLGIVLDYAGPLMKWVVLSYEVTGSARNVDISLRQNIGVYSTPEKAAYAALPILCDLWSGEAVDREWFACPDDMLVMEAGPVYYLTKEFPADQKARERCALAMFIAFSIRLALEIADCDSFEETMFVSIVEMPEL
jgi:hypothetical protein